MIVSLLRILICAKELNKWSAVKHLTYKQLEGLNLIELEDQVLAAIDEMEALYGDKLFIYRSGKIQIADGLTKSAYFSDTREEETWRSVVTVFEKLNDTARTVTKKNVECYC